MHKKSNIYDRTPSPLGGVCRYAGVIRLKVISADEKWYTQPSRVAGCDAAAAVLLLLLLPPAFV